MWTNEADRISRREQTEGAQCQVCGSYYASMTPNFCKRCCLSGLLQQVDYRPADFMAPSVGSKSAFELTQLDQQTFGLPAYPEITVGPGAVILVGGPPGAGKSTLALNVAAASTPSAYLPLECGIGPALSELCRRLEVREKKLRFYLPKNVSEVFAIAEADGLKLLAIDSVNVSTIQPEDCTAMAKAHGVLVLALIQVCKDGGFAGSNRWVHEADTVISVADLRWEVQKNRFGAAGVRGGVLCE